MPPNRWLVDFHYEVCYVARGGGGLLYAVLELA